MSRPKILFLHHVPIHNRVKSKRYEDGLATSLRNLEAHYDIHWNNLVHGLRADPNEFDLLLVQSNWNWICDVYARSQLANCKVPKALLIAGVTDPPSLADMQFYDLLFYETDWYRPKIQLHPNIVHAFGVDTDVMKPTPVAVKRYDYLTVGGVFEFKQQYKLFEKSGKRLLVGEFQYSRYAIGLLIRMALRGIRIRNYTSYAKLAEFYRMSRVTYIPARTHGGGERAVLESRACGTPVEIEPDNPKLKEILDGPILDHHYYAKQLKLGIDRTL